MISQPFAALRRAVLAAAALLLSGRPAWALDYGYTITSDPVGFVNQAGAGAPGTAVTTPSLHGENAGYTFSYWSVNGIRQTDASGVATPVARFQLTATTTAVAVYLPTTADTDRDGVPDWFEWQQFGSLDRGNPSVGPAVALPNFHAYLAGLSGSTASPIEVVGLGSSVGNGAGLSAPLTPETDAPVAWFTNRLGAYLNRTGAYTLAAQNFSRGGGVIIDTVQTDYPSAVAAGHPGKIVLIAEGMNDGQTANFNSGQCFNNVYVQLKNVVEMIRAQGADPVICTTVHPHTVRTGWSLPANLPQVYPTPVDPPVPDTAIWPTVADSTPSIYWKGHLIPTSRRHAMVNEAMRQVARDLGVALIDVEPYWFDAVAARGQDALFDENEYVHPNNLGYQLSYQAAIDDWLHSTFDGTALAVNFDPDGDGFPISVEAARGYSPNLVDKVSDGGVSSRRSASFLTYVAATEAGYTINSEPLGYVSQTGVAALGTSITTPMLHGESSGYTFAYWRVNGERQADGAGVAKPSATFVLSRTTVATAIYVRTTDDADSDGVPDWYEWQQFGGLAQAAGSDPDGDGIAVGVEAARGYSPKLADTLVDGGIASRRSGATLTYVSANDISYTFNSEPSGYVNQTGVGNRGSTVVTPNLHGESAGYTFAYWRVNGVRQADAGGAAKPSVQITLTETTTATAVYVSTTADTDADGVPDWYEWQQFGGLSQTSAADPDGDGLPIGIEATRGYSPRLVDTLVDGGVASRRSAATLAFAAVIEFSAPTITAQPVSITAGAGGNVTFSVTAGGVPTPTYQWTFNGVAIAGATGSSLTLTNVKPADVGSYAVTISNSLGSVTSTAATLSPNTPPPNFVSVPADVAVTTGQPATWTVVAGGSGTMSYQWRRNGFPIAGATTASYTIASTSRTDADFYDVVVANGLAVATSPAARLDVAPSTYPGLVTVDPTWNVEIETPNAAVNKVLPLAGGKFLVAGDFVRVNGHRTGDVARFNADGAIDPTFVAPVLNGYAKTLAVQADGKILVGGDFTVTTDGVTRRHLIRLGADGAIDPSFNAGGSGPSWSVVALVVAPDGKIYVGGGFASYNDVARNYMARLNADGTLDPGYYPSANNAVSAMALQSDGKLLIGGSFGFVASTSRSRLARLNADGSLDTGFTVGSGFDNEVRAVALAGNGKIYVGGYFSSYNGTSGAPYVRLTDSGTLDTTFATANFSGYQIETLFVQADEKVLMGGNFFTVRGSTRNYLARLTADGSLDSSPAINFNGGLYSVAALSDGSVLAAGHFNVAGSSERQFLARIAADGTLDAGLTPTFRQGGSVRSIALVPGGKVAITGDFTTVNGTSRNNIAQLNADGSVDTTFNPGTGLNSNAVRVVRQADGKLVVAGYFNLVNGQYCWGLVRMLADGPVDPTFVVTAAPPYGIGDLAIRSGGRVLIGGSFSNYHFGSAGTRSCLAQFAADGSLDPTWTATTDSQVNQLALQADGKVLLGGYFSKVNGVGRYRVARLAADGTLDATFDPAAGPEGEITALASLPGAKSWLGGNFYSYAGYTRQKLARLQSTGALDTGFGVVPFSGWTDSPVIARILPQNDGKVIIAGGFSALSSAPATRYLARLNADGTVDASFGAFGLDAALVDLAQSDDGRLYFTGKYGFGRLSAVVPPTVSTPPATQTAEPGANVTLTVTATGSGPFTYQWARNGTAISGATSATLVLSNVTSRNSGSYTVTVSNGGGVYSSTSAAAIVTVHAPPTITTQPQSQAVVLGAAVSLSVTAEGSPPFSYQWKKGTTAISGATSATFVIASFGSGDVGSYTVNVTDSQGTSTSSPATLTAAALKRALANISTRGRVLGGERALLANFTIEGTSPKSVLVRGLGPVLTSMGVSSGDALADPTVTIYDGTGVPVTGNDNWDSSLASVFTTVGAMGLTAGSKDAAVVATLNPGTYTARVDGVGGATGLALIEVYETDGTGRLVYLSTRGNAGTGNDAIVGGFIVSGTDPVQVLIRGMGQGLSAAGLSNAIVDPVISVRDATHGNIVVGTNDDSSGNTTLNDAVAVAGLRPYTSGLDSGLLLTVNPGVYSFTLSDLGSRTGTGLIEIAQIDAQRAPSFAPALTAPQMAQSVQKGAVVTFPAPFVARPSAVTWQWKKTVGNVTTDVAGATGPVLTLLNVGAADSATYRVVMTNSAGTTTSAGAALTVIVPPPSITMAPLDYTATAGGGATFTAAASGDGPFTYQWQRNGQDLAGATSATLTVPSVSPTDSGAAYRVVVTNSGGSTTSAAATLTLRGYGSTGSQFVAVGQGGTILTSGDGATWTSRVSGTVQRLRGVAASGNRFVAVGELGTILTSPTGTSWTSAVSGTFETLRGVAASPTKFVAVGGHDAGYVLTSADGLTWTASSLPPGTGKLRAAAWGNGGFVAVGAGGTTLTSPDGVAWTARSAGTSARIDAVFWTGTQFEALTSSGTRLTSGDGISWTDGGAVTAPSWLETLTWSDSRYLVAGASGRISTSVAGSVWSGAATGTAVTIHGATWSGSVVAPAANLVASLAGLADAPTITMQPQGVLVAHSGGSATFTVSYTGGPATFQWLKDGSPITDAHASTLVLTNVQTGNAGKYSVVVTTGAGSATSQAATLSLRGTGTTGQQFVAVGESGLVLTSLDGQTWTPHAAGTPWNLRGVTARNDLFVAVGEAGAIVSSPTGATWTLEESGTNETLRSVAGGPDRFVAVGGHVTGYITTSTDGHHWTRAILPDGSMRLRSVTFGAGGFVAVGADGTTLTSPDGLTWTRRNPALGNRLDVVVWTGAQYFAVSQFGAITTSPDGVVWTAGGTVTPPAWLEGFTWSDARYLAVGADGTIEASALGAYWTGVGSGTLATLYGVTWSGEQPELTGDLAGKLTGLSSIPTITTQPPPVTALADGSALVLGVQATGEGLSYQWFKNGQAIGGQTSATLALTVTTADSGSSYSVTVTNAAGSLVSGSTRVTVSAIGTTGSQFVVVGDSGRILTSADGLTWAARTTGTNLRLRGVAATANRLIAVGEYGTILWSADGATWSNVASGTTETLRAVATDRSRFVAVGGHDVGYALTSSDGASWTPVSLPGGTGKLRAVTCGNGTFVAVGAGGAILSTADGASWTRRTSSLSGRLDAVIWTGARFIVVSETGDLAASVDGTTWTAIGSTRPPDWLEAFSWSPSAYLAVGVDGTVERSSDGTTWTGVLCEGRSISFGIPKSLHAVVWTGAQRLPQDDPAALFNRLNQLPGIVHQPVSVLTLIVGGSWTLSAEVTGEALSYQWWSTAAHGYFEPEASQTTQTLVKATGGGPGNYYLAVSNAAGSRLSLPSLVLEFPAGALGSRFIAAGDNGTLVTSDNGVTWTTQATSTIQNLRAVATSPVRAVVVGEVGTILSSTDAVNWTPAASGTTETLRGVASGAYRFVAVGGHVAGYALWSADGSAWSVASVPAGTGRLRAATYGYGIFLAVGDGGVVLTSADGQAWTARTSGTSARMDGVMWTGTRFQAVTQYGQSLTSPDGITWSLGGTSAPPAWLEGFCWNDISYLVVGAGGHVALSTDGAVWNAFETGMTATLRGVAWSGGQMVPSGDVIAQLTNLRNLPVITTQPVATTTVSVGATLTLNVTASGSGLSYQWRKNGVAIGGQTAATLSLANIRSADNGSLFDVVVTNNAGSTTSTATTLTVGGPSFAAFKAQYFTTSEQSHSTISGPTADPDGDGLSNLLEYAGGSNPRVNDPAGLPVIGTDSGRLTLTYTKRNDLADLTYTVEATSDLTATWTSGAGVTEPLSSTVIDATHDRVVVRDLTALSAIAHRFLRLRVTLGSPTASAVSPPLGAVNLSHSPGTRLTGMPLVNASTARDRIASHTATALTLANLANVGALLTSTTSYFVEVTGGPATSFAGERFELDVAATKTAANNTVVIVASSPRNTLASLPAGNALAGCTVVIRPHVTLGQLFGTKGTTPMFGSTIASSADQIQFLNAQTQSFEIYYLLRNATGTIEQWLKVGAGATNQDTLPVPSGTGMVVVRNGTTPVNFTWLGEVRQNAFPQPLVAGNNLVAQPFPVDVSPVARAMSFGNGFTGSTIASSADQVQVYVSGVFQIYYLLRNSTGTVEQWTKVGGGGTNYSQVQLIGGDAAVVVRKINADANYMVPLPASLTP